MSGHLTTLLTAATAPAAWGTTYVVTTQLLPPGRPLLAATLRALVAGLVILAATRAVPPRAWLWRITVLGALNFGFFFPLLFFSAYRLPGGVAATVGAAQPLIVALEGWVLLGRRPAIARVGAGLTAACGVALLVVEPSAKLDVVGVLAALAGTLSMATGIVMTERWGRPAPLLAFTGWQLVVGGAMVVPIALAVEGVPAALTLRNGVGYVYLAVVGAAVAYPLWLRGIERLGGSATSFLAILSPLTAAVAGLFVLGQGLTFRQWIGFGIALGSVLAAQLAPAGRRTGHACGRLGLPDGAESLAPAADRPRIEQPPEAVETVSDYGGGAVVPCWPGRRHDLLSLRSQTRDAFLATLPTMARTSATPWGTATVVDELSLRQRAGDKRFASVVQLLEIRGERLVRFAYATGGSVRRGPVTFRGRDLERFRTELVGHPELAATLGWEVTLGRERD